MKRKITAKFLNWKNMFGRLPLLLYGARQIGKTYSILEFGKRYYDSVAYFNFEANREAGNVFEKDFSVDRIIRELSALSGVSISKNSTLIIFDEIQACERGLTALKYFAENSPEYHIISAGSLLGVAVNREKFSFPVGKVEMLTMFPLDFEEFLWALGNEHMTTLIRNSYANDAPFSLHESAMDYYRKYLIIGGMPQAILEYLNKNDYDFVRNIQQNINSAYLADMSKYSSASEAVKIAAAYTSIPQQLAKDNKKFQYNVIKSNARAKDYEIALDWLSSAGVVLKCNKVGNPYLPLTANAENSSFKVYLSDVGLLTSKINIPYNVILSENPNFDRIKGAVVENYVASALSNLGYDLFYWESKGNAEVDFLLQNSNGDIIPVEVKSSHNVRSKSLRQYQEYYSPKYSIRVSQKNFGYENEIRSVPLYSLFCLVC